MSHVLQQGKSLLEIQYFPSCLVKHRLIGCLPDMQIVSSQYTKEDVVPNNDEGLQTHRTSDFKGLKLLQEQVTLKNQALSTERMIFKDCMLLVGDVVTFMLFVDIYHTFRQKIEIKSFTLTFCQYNWVCSEKCAVKCCILIDHSFSNHLWDISRALSRSQVVSSVVNV